MSKESLKLCFLVTFNIIISYIFPDNFTEIHQVPQKIWIFTSSISTIFVNFLICLPLLATKKANDISLHKMITLKSNLKKIKIKIALKKHSPKAIKL